MIVSVHRVIFFMINPQNIFSKLLIWSWTLLLTILYWNQMFQLVVFYWGYSAYTMTSPSWFNIYDNYCMQYLCKQKKLMDILTFSNNVNKYAPVYWNLTMNLFLIVLVAPRLKDTNRLQKKSWKAKRNRRNA